MKMVQRHLDIPFFSVCIPQYNRTSFLIESCRSLMCQTFTDFEVCISDDCSTDGRESELLAFLQQSGLSFTYRRQEHNMRYDGNLRTAIGLARGRYCFLLGNDDSLASTTTLAELHNTICCFEPIGVAITNYAAFTTGERYNRMKRTGVLGNDPTTAIRHFRDFSFVSGVILERERAQAFATTRWDGSEMYQVFIGCRMIAEGAVLLGIDQVAIRKDIQITGEHVDSYAQQPKLKPCPIVERRIPLVSMSRLVMDAIEPYIPASSKQSTFEKIITQILLFTYPFWLVEYRRVQSWQYALGIALGMRTRNLIMDFYLNPIQRLRLNLIYGIMTLAGLFVPIKLFRFSYPWLYSFAKSQRVNSI